MNERIQELADQANITVRGHYDETGSTPAELQRFAELIIKECSQFVEDKFDFCGDELIIAEQILEHFGVEE